MIHSYISISKIVSYYFYVQRSLVPPCLSEMYTHSDECPSLRVALQRDMEQWHCSSSKYLRGDSSLTTALWGWYGVEKDGDSLWICLMLSRSVCHDWVRYEKNYGVIASLFQQREDATPSKHLEKGQEEIRWQQGSIKSYGTRRTGVSDSASLEMADLSSLVVPSGLRMEISLLLRKISFWQPGTDNGTSQLMESPLLHWSICETNVSFRTNLYCLLVTAFYKASPGWKTGPCWMVMKFGNYLCVDLMLPNFTAVRESYRRFSIK